MAGWCWFWRITVTWQSRWFSPTGVRVQVLDVDSVAQLREHLLAYRADPRVEHYRYRRHRFWDETDMPPTCQRGHQLAPPYAYQVLECRCGHGHADLGCICGDRQLVPPPGPGCGPLPGGAAAPLRHPRPGGAAR